jgi:hypothetical protein
MMGLAGGGQGWAHYLLFSNPSTAAPTIAADVRVE